MIFTLPLSSKGQFTIPSKIRKQLGITQGSLLKVTLLHDKAIVEPYTTTDITNFFGTLKGPRPPSRQEVQDGLWGERLNKKHATNRG